MLSMCSKTPPSVIEKKRAAYAARLKRCTAPLAQGLLFLIRINFRLKSPLAFLAEGMLTQIKRALSGERRTRGRTNGGGDSSTGSLQLWRQTETSARVATLPQARQLRRRHSSLS